MIREIITISADGTNCYLLKIDRGYILIDTHFPFRRKMLEETLEKQGCTPENLKLVLLTHGDIDHSGNCTYLRRQYGVKIAMHTGDAPMCLKDGITRDRGKVPDNFPLPLMVLWLLKGFIRYSFRQALWRKPFEPFEADILLEEGQSLADYGLNASILYTPGHSAGSVSILTDSGDLFCGDMFNNLDGRILVSAEEGVLERIKDLDIGTIYPGHGEPFTIEQLSSGS